MSFDFRVSKEHSSYVEACAACGAPAPGDIQIHRDGFGEGPEVELCAACGADDTPTCEEIWSMIAARS